MVEKHIPIFKTFSPLSSSHNYFIAGERKYTVKEMHEILGEFLKKCPSKYEM